MIWRDGFSVAGWAGSGGRSGCGGWWRSVQLLPRVCAEGGGAAVGAVLGHGGRGEAAERLLGRGADGAGDGWGMVHPGGRPGPVGVSGREAGGAADGGAGWARGLDRDRAERERDGAAAGS